MLNAVSRRRVRHARPTLAPNCSRSGRTRTRVAQWLRICLPEHAILGQGTKIPRALGPLSPVGHNWREAPTHHNQEPVPVCWVISVLSDSLHPLWTAALQAPLSMGSSRQEHCSGLLCPPPGALPDPGIEPASPASPVWPGGFFATSVTWEAPN